MVGHVIGFSVRDHFPTRLDLLDRRLQDLNDAESTAKEFKEQLEDQGMRKKALEELSDALDAMIVMCGCDNAEDGAFGYQNFVEAARAAFMMQYQFQGDDDDYDADLYHELEEECDCDDGIYE